MSAAQEFAADSAPTSSATLAGAEPADPEQHQVGVTVAGRYVIDRPLGEGALGAVVAARHLSLDETVVIKFPRREVRRDPIAVAHFTREAKALARIKSHHVARVLDVGVSLAVGPYLVMEYLEGADLGSVLRSEGPLSVPRAVEYVLQACEALVVAHAEGITHRDIKPQNLFLARYGQFETLKVLDFGISPLPARPAAAAAAPDAASLGAASLGAASLGAASLGAVARSPEGLPLGTPAYMSPERIRNDPHADYRADIWSLGVVLHELVTGRPVFEGESAADICARVLEAPWRLELAEPLLPPELRAIIARCLTREPEGRFQSVSELATALMPLANMSERFRCGLTGSFPRSARVSEHAQPMAEALATPEPAPTATAGHRTARERLRRGPGGSSPGLSSRVFDRARALVERSSLASRYFGVAAASVAATCLALSYLATPSSTSPTLPAPTPETVVTAPLMPAPTAPGPAAPSAAVPSVAPLPTPPGASAAPALANHEPAASPEPAVSKSKARRGLDGQRPRVTKPAGTRVTEATRLPNRINMVDELAKLPAKKPKPKPRTTASGSGSPASGAPASARPAPSRPR